MRYDYYPIEWISADVTVVLLVTAGPRITWYVNGHFNGDLVCGNENFTAPTLSTAASKSMLLNIYASVNVHSAVYLPYPLEVCLLHSLPTGPETTLHTQLCSTHSIVLHSLPYNKQSIGQ